MGDHGSDRLATYGSLRPGEQHHDVMAGLEVVGSGLVRGVVDDWEGYPILTPDPQGDEVAVVVFGGIDPERWAALDDFEGPAYRRTTVQVRLDDGRDLPAQCYVRDEGLRRR